MNIKKRSTKSLRNILLLFLGLIAVVVMLYFVLQPKDSGIDTNNTTRADEIKRSIKTDEDKSAQGLPPDSTRTTSQDVPTSNFASIKIISVSQADGYVRAKAETSGDGTCVFLYTTAGDKPVTFETKAENMNCSGETPEINFSKLGEWMLKVTYYSDAEKSEDSKNVTIN